MSRARNRRIDAALVAVEGDLTGRAEFVKAVSRLQAEVARRAHHAALASVRELEEILSPYEPVLGGQGLLRTETFVNRLREAERRGYLGNELRSLMKRNTEELLQVSKYVGTSLGQLVTQYAPPQHSCFLCPRKR